MKLNTNKTYLKPKFFGVFVFFLLVSSLYSNNYPLALILPGKKAVVSSRVNSIVSKLFIREGDRVKKGQSAVILDSKPFTLKKNALLKRLAALKVKEEYLDKEFRRSEKLVRRSAIARSTYDNAKFQRDQNIENMQMLENEIRVLELDIEFCKITIPFDGLITKIITHEHEHVKIGSPVFKIVADNTLQIIANFNEKMIHKIEPGQLMNIQFRNSEKVYPAKITKIVSKIDPETKTFKVIGKINNKDKKLKIGMIGYCLNISNS